MESREFVQRLVDECEELFEQLGDRETLEAESEGRVEVVTLLKLALKSELEASEIAGYWLPTTAEIDAKSAFAGQCGDEMKHYSMITQRLLELGAEPGDLQTTSSSSPLYHYLLGLKSTVERVAAGPFAREAVAKVRNQQFIDFCRAVGDTVTAELYENVIQPEEVHHHEVGRSLLEKYAITPEQQELAGSAMRNSLAIADELRTLAEKSTGLHPIPSS